MELLDKADLLLERFRAREELGKKIKALREKLEKSETAHKVKVKKLEDQIKKEDANFQKNNQKTLNELQEALREWEEMEKITDSEKADRQNPKN